MQKIRKIDLKRNTKGRKNCGILKPTASKNITQLQSNSDVKFKSQKK